MATNNKHLFTNEEGIIMCNIDGSRAVLPARAVCAWYIQRVCAVKRWTYTDAPNDGGIDCVTAKGTKRFQAKVLTAESRSSIPTTLTFDSKEEALDFTEAEMLEIIRDYVELFDGNLIAYITTYRGDAFDKSNAYIIENKEEAVKFLYMRASQSWSKCGKKFTRQIKISMHEKPGRMWA